VYINLRLYEDVSDIVMKKLHFFVI